MDGAESWRDGFARSLGDAAALKPMVSEWFRIENAFLVRKLRWETGRCTRATWLYVADTGEEAEKGRRKGLGKGFELDFEVRRKCACLIEGIRNCRRSETAIVVVGDSLLEVVRFLSSTFEDGWLS